MMQLSDDNIVSALKLANIGFYRYLFDGTIVSIDQTTFDFFELEDIFQDPQSLVGQKIESLITYTGPKGRLRTEIKEKGKVAGLEYGFKTLQGKEKWGIHNSYFLVDEEAGKGAVQVCFYDITDRKQAENSIKQQEERFQLVIKGAGLGLWDWDLQTNKVVFNDNYFAMLGYDKDEFPHTLETWKNLLHPEDKDRLIRQLQSCLDHDRPWSLEFRLKSKYDEYKWILGRGGIVTRGHDGEPLRVTGTHQDITERKLTEEKLQLFRKQIDSSSDMIFIIEPLTGKCLDANQAACKYMQYSISELLSMKVKDAEIFLPDEPSWEKHVEDLKRTGTELREGAIRRRDGTICPVEINTRYVILTGKEYIVAVARDITDRKQADKALKKSENLLADIIDQSPFSTWIADANGTNIRQNAACRKLFGIDSDDQTVGKYNLFKDPLTKTQGHLKEIEKVFKEGKTARFTLDYDFSLVDHVNIPHATHTILDVTIFAIKDEEGRVVNAVVQDEDITKRKQAEKELLRSMKEIEEANMELKQFSYVMAHDLKAPIRAISNYSSFLQEDLADSLTGTQKEYLERLKETAVETGSMVEDLLSLARIGRADIEKKPVDLGELVKSIISSMNSGTDVQIELAEDWPTIDSDAILLRQVFQNLIDNALKYNISPVKRVELVCFSAADGGVECFVRDNGIGIDAEYHEQIFRMFERLHAPKEYSGSGVGLALVKRAVERLGGTIRLESTPGKGSTFYLSLPKNHG